MSSSTCSPAPKMRPANWARLSASGCARSRIGVGIGTLTGLVICRAPVAMLGPLLGRMPCSLKNRCRLEQHAEDPRHGTSREHQEHKTRADFLLPGSLANCPKLWSGVG